MDKTAIAHTFGQTEKAGRSYDALLSEYLVKLHQGGKAPERYVPAPSSIDGRTALCGTLTKLVKHLCTEIEGFDDHELDTLQVPHPLLGSISLREMLYNTIYHVKHHQAQVEENLKITLTGKDLPL